MIISKLVANTIIFSAANNFFNCQKLTKRCRTFACEQLIKVMSNKIKHGHVKVVFCSKPEEKVKAIWQDVLKQPDEESVHTIIYTTNHDSKEWTKQLLKTAGVTPENPDESLMRGISEMPLYIGANKSYDLGYLTWLIIRDVNTLDIKRVYIESPESLRSSCPENEGFSVGIAAGTILRHLADSLKIEIILISSSTLPGDKDAVLEFPDVYVEPSGIIDYIDEIVYSK